MSSHGNIWQEFFRQPAGAATSARHRPVPAERPVERNGPTPATASAIPARARPDPAGRTLPGPAGSESVLVGCPSTRYLSASKRPYMFGTGRPGMVLTVFTQYLRTVERPVGPRSVEHRDRSSVGIRCRRYDRGAASGGWRQDWMRRLEDATLRSDRRHRGGGPDAGHDRFRRDGPGSRGLTVLLADDPQPVLRARAEGLPEAARHGLQLPAGPAGAEGAHGDVPVPDPCRKTVLLRGRVGRPAQATRDHEPGRAVVVRQGARAASLRHAERGGLGQRNPALSAPGPVVKGPPR